MSENQTAPDFDMIALGVVNQIEAMPSGWKSTRRKAHAQCLIIEALKSAAPRTPDVAATPMTVRDFVRLGITGFKEHELREIVAVFCKLPGVAPRLPDPAQPPTNKQLHDAIAHAVTHRTYSGIQDAVREIQKLYAIPQCGVQTRDVPLNAIQFIALLEVLGECAEHVPTELKARINNLLDYHTDHDTASALPSAECK